MPSPTKPYNDFYKKALIFEGSLALLAQLLGWFAGINPFQYLTFSEPAVLYGVLGTLPLFMMFLGLQKLQANSVNAIRDLLLKSLGPVLHRYHWTDLLLLATVAGVSEELLFRGLLQPWLEASWGAAAGLILSNLVFGLVHAATPLYAVLAMLVGLFLGMSMDYGVERNLLTPVIIHSLYDFLAFFMLLRGYRASLAQSPNTTT